MFTLDNKLCATVSYMAEFKEIANNFRMKIKSVATRGTFANLFMFSFIMLTGIGAGLIALPIGLIVAGIGCGIFGFLLGLE